MKRIFAIVAGIVTVFVAIGLILPALAKVRDEGAMPAEVVALYTLGIVLALAGAGVAALGLFRGKTIAKEPC